LSRSRLEPQPVETTCSYDTAFSPTMHPTNPANSAARTHENGSLPVIIA